MDLVSQLLLPAAFRNWVFLQQ